MNVPKTEQSGMLNPTDKDQALEAVARIIDPEPWIGPLAGLYIMVEQRDIALAKAVDILQALSRPVVDEAENAYHAHRIAEVMDDGDGFWRACSGCQESVDGYVSTRDYPHSKTFRCQPGGGCRECGGLGVIWDNIDYGAMAEDMLADEAEDDDLATLRAESERLREFYHADADVRRVGRMNSTAEQDARLDRARAALSPPDKGV
jgi:hypothetical protein